MKMSISLYINIKEKLKDKLLTNDYFNDLSKKENELLYIRDISSYNDEAKIRVEVINPIKFSDTNIIERVIEKYKKNIYIDDFYWSEIGGYDAIINTRYYYNNGVKTNNLIKEKYSKEELIESIKEDNLYYFYVPDKYKYDVEFNLEVINTFDVISDLPDEMKLNKEVLYKCLINDGYIFDYKCENKNIYNNCDIKEMYIKANKNNNYSHICSFIPKKLYSDKDFVMQLINDNKTIISDIYLLLNDDLKIDKDIINLYIHDHRCNIKNLDKRVKKTDDLIKTMILSNIDNLIYTKYKNDIDVVNLLIKKHNYSCYVLRSIGKTLKNNKEFMKNFFNNSMHYQEHVTNPKKYKQLLELDNSILIIEEKEKIVIRKNKIVKVKELYIDEFFKYLSNELLNDLDFIQELIDQNLPF